MLERAGESVYPLPRAVAMDSEVQRLLQTLGLADRLFEHMEVAPGGEFVDATGLIRSTIRIVKPAKEPA